MKNTRKIIFILLFAVLFSYEKASCSQYNMNLFELSGKDAKDSIFFIEIPKSYSHKIFIRIFDADIGGAYDKQAQDSEVNYNLYGKDYIDNSESGQPPLLTLKLKKNRYYDNQWRTLGELNLSQGQAKDEKIIFKLTAGITGNGNNKYKIYISSEDKLNKPVKQAILYSHVLNLALEPAGKKLTQVSFNIPGNAAHLNFLNSQGSNLFFDTHIRKNISLNDSKKTDPGISQINIENEEKGGKGAVIILNKVNKSIKLEITDDNGSKIPLLLPDLLAPENNLPVPDIKAIPLSECTKIILDATASTDKDNDELRFKWTFPDNTQKKGSRITHDFLKPGKYQVFLEVKDNSGFIASTSRISKTIEVNSPPTAKITAPDIGLPGKPVIFDASKSSDKDGNIKQFSWDFDDGTTAKGQKVNHIFSQPGKYEVSLIIEDNGKGFCTQDKIFHTIIINTRPIAHIQMQEMAAVNEIVKPDPGKSIDSDGEIIEYEWDFGDNTKSSEKNPSHQWEKPGTYIVQLKIKDDSNTPNSTALYQKQIIINAPPVPGFKLPKIVAANEEIEFNAGDSKDPDGNIIKYVWETGDGNIKYGRMINHKYEKPGIYSGKLIVTDDSQMTNDTVSKNFSIRVNDPPLPDFGRDRIVNSSIVEFNAEKSHDTDDEIIEYLWDFGDSQTGTGKKISHSYSSPGNYTVKLTIKDSSGTISAAQSKTVNIRVNYPPIADAGPDIEIAAGQSALFNSSFSKDPDGKIISYEWHINNNIVKNRETGFKFDTFGIYNARLKVSDNDGAQDFDSVLIRVNAPPTPCFSHVQRAAPGQSITFDASCSHDPDGEISKAIWNFGDGSKQETGILVKHKYKNPGRYKVSLSVQDDSKVSNNRKTISQIMEINYTPKADAGSDIHTCSQVVSFDASQSTDADKDNLTYSWDFGDGTIYQGMKVTHAYDNPGVYPVTLTVDDNTGTANSVSRSNIIAYVNTPPTARINLSEKNICANRTVFFDAGRSADPEGGLLRYAWDLGDGETSEKRNPHKTYKKGGDYKIQLTVYDETELECNYAHDQVMLHVMEAPVADAGPDRDVCANTLVQFDGSKSTGGHRLIKSYEWDFGDGNKSVGLKANHVYSDAGQYRVKLKITAAGDGICENTSVDFADVKVIQASQPVFTSKLQACVGEKVNFNARASKSSEGKITQYIWNFGDGNSSPGLEPDLTFGPEPYYIYNKPGEYKVNLKITTDSGHDCNNAEISKIIRINKKPDAKISVAMTDQASTSLESLDTYVNTLIRFSGAQSKDPDRFIKKYEWDLGDTNKKTGAYISHQYEKPGTYKVSLTVYDDSDTQCRQAEAVMNINVLKYPEIPVIGPETACVNEELSFSIPEIFLRQGENKSIEWSFSDNTSAKGNPVNKIFSSPGTCQVQAKIGELISLAKNVIIKTGPEIIIPDSIQGFPGDKIEISPVHINQVYLSSYDENLIFQWDTGDNTILDSKEFSHIYEKPGKYKAGLTIKLENGLLCQDKNYPVSIEILAPPQAEIKTDPDVIFSGGARDEVIFKSIIKGKSQNWNTAWDFGDNQKAFGKTVKHTFAKPGKYQVIMTLSHVKIRSQVFNFTKTIVVQKR